VPISWGVDPYLFELFPAILEYYASTATSNDTFFAGASGTINFSTPIMRI
jgi:hypothetical protein